jgi:hypothetical protein
LDSNLAGFRYFHTQNGDFGYEFPDEYIGVSRLGTWILTVAVSQATIHVVLTTSCLVGFRDFVIFAIFRVARVHMAILRFKKGMKHVQIWDSSDPAGWGIPAGRVWDFRQSCTRLPILDIWQLAGIDPGWIQKDPKRGPPTNPYPISSTAGPQ